MAVRLSELAELLAREVEEARLRLALAGREMARELRALGLDGVLTAPPVRITRASFDLAVAVAAAEALPAAPAMPTAEMEEALRRGLAALPERAATAPFFTDAPRLARLWRQEAAAALTSALRELPAATPPALVRRLLETAARAVWLGLLVDPRASLRLRDIRRLAGAEVVTRIAAAVGEVAAGIPRPAAPAADGGLRLLITADELREAGTVGHLRLEVEEEGVELRAFAQGEAGEGEEE